ncbi:MAG TPA: CheR family methyltransferase, partial [Steroidobacteraceae bacterium]
MRSVPDKPRKAAASPRQARPDNSKGAPIAQASEPRAVVGIGASAGGLQAFASLLASVPADTGLAFVLVPHLSAQHESQLADILSRSTTMPVREVHDSPAIRANHVYVIPPDRDILSCNHVLSLRQRLPGSHHPVDVFFATLAESHAHRAIGVVLSGTGNDGTLGLQAIKSAGGITFAQDQSAVHGDMPRNAIAGGFVDFVLPPEAIARELTRLAGEPYVSGAEIKPAASSDIEQILGLVRAQLGVDFSQYKPSTLQRRIHRRMTLQKIARLGEYREHLQGHPEEVKALYEDILISVTTFFRNAEAFEALKQSVLPKLFAGRANEDPIRAWVLGCATGEEAYSLAIILSEYAQEQRQGTRINIYATDLNDASIERARRGWYPRGIVQDVSPQRLQRFFYESDGGYGVHKSLREVCIFARHNALTNPPFSRMDLVTCRNVLIYMDAALQKKMLSVLHYTLKPGGYLLLGPSESITQQRELFDIADTKQKIYAKRLVSRHAMNALPVPADLM